MRYLPCPACDRRAIRWDGYIVRHCVLAGKGWCELGGRNITDVTPPA